MFDESPESLRFGVMRVDNASGKSSWSCELKLVDELYLTESKQAEVILRYRDKSISISRTRQSACLF